MRIDSILTGRDEKTDLAPSRYYRPDDTDGIELLTCTSRHSFQDHIHDGYNIWFNDKGGEWFRIKGKSRIVALDEFGIVNPGDVHANQPCDTGLRRLKSFYVDRRLIRKLLRHCGWNDTATVDFPRAIYRDPENRTRLIELHEALRHSSMKLHRQTLMLETFARIIMRHGQGLRIKPEKNDALEKLSPVFEYMRHHLADDVSLETLAGLIRCTPYHLIRMFKQATGLPPHAYLVRLRIEKARHLLATGASIASAAMDAGFSDQSHLTRLFKKSFGITPGSYVKQVLR
mgnify:CR=1 FL=1